MNATLWGTVVAALVAAAAAIYTARQTRQSQVTTAKQTNDALDRESQRQAQARLLDALQKETDTLNARIAELRDRLNKAEDFADSERNKRREIEEKLEQVLDSIQRLKDIISQIPGAQDNPEVQRILAKLNQTP